MPTLFDQTDDPAGDYDARHIEVLEGLEPVRRRPGMYIGGTDERAMHHLVAEVLDNAMDEAIQGHASWIELSVAPDDVVTVRDNGRGIPIGEHPKFPGRSALEVIATTLHAGGKFSGRAYDTSGGLNGVGLSVVNALSDSLRIEVALNRQLWVQTYRRGQPTGPVAPAGPVQNRRGTSITFHPDPEIFGGDLHFRTDRLFRLARSKAYLHRGIELRWRCAPSLLPADGSVPAEATLRFPGGLAEFLAATLDGRATLTPAPFLGEAQLPDGLGRVEWAVAWPEDDEAEGHFFCNAVPTPQGGTHEAGLRTGLARGVKAFADRANGKRAATLTAEDVAGGAVLLLSLFIRNPQFQGQTKERLSNPEAARLIDAILRDHVEHWLAADPAAANALIDRFIARAEERIRRRDAKTERKSPTRRLRLPGKLADCSRSGAHDTEVFLVEGDSAGGSAKSARDRETQAVLPLRGKILNVASASADKLAGNQEIADLVLALGCGTRGAYSEKQLRYERVIIMTDADVDGAHIASLLMTFFYREMPGLIRDGHLFLAQPPLYRLQQGGLSHYARDDAHKDELMRTVFKGRGKIEISRFKGLGEMPAAQLRDTTMSRAKRTLWRIDLADGSSGETTGTLVEQLMGRRPELRLRFIQSHAAEARDIDV